MTDKIYCILKVKMMKGDHPELDDYYTGTVEDTIAYLITKHSKNGLLKVSTSFIWVFKGMVSELDAELERRKKLGDPELKNGHK